MKNISLKYSIVFLAILAIIALEFSACHKTKTNSVPSSEMMVELGRKLFFDNSLSNPVGQSCATCHSPATAFTDPAHNIVSPGIFAGLFGNRNAPTAMYAKFSPPLHYSVDDSAYVGGLFLDGRVNTLEEQAQKPFLNPLEMGNTGAAMLISKLHGSINYGFYKQVFGDITDVNTTFANIATAIAAFERSDTLNAFTSKYDYYLKGMATLSPSELRGLNLFNDTLRAMCVNCHLTSPDPASGKILFTDFSYENDGVPRNAYNPYYTIPAVYNLPGLGYVDFGLGDFINDSDNYGTFRTPTLRNVAISAPYFHNGSFGTLEQVVHFYNTRDSVGSGFDAPEYAATIDHTETGNQHLSAQEEADIVAFLKTLTDGYQP